MSESKIAFIGSHSTGKTTVARPIAETLGVPFLSEVARDVARDWGLTPATIPADRVLDYQWEILHRQIEREQQHPAWVSDRSTLDNCAYFEAYAEHQTTPEDAARYKRRAWGNTVHYDRLILIPPMFAPVDDGERHTDPAEQLRVHRIVCDLIDAWGLAEKVYTVTSATVEGRINEILRVLEVVKC